MTISGRYGLLAAVVLVASVADPGRLAAATSIQAYGAVCNGVADDTLALQAACQTAPNHTALFIPSGGCRVTATIDCGGRSISLSGDSPGGAANGSHAGAVIFGDVAGPLWRFVYPAMDVSIDGVGFHNTNPVGIGLAAGGMGIALSRLGVNAYIGVDISSNTFTLSLRDSVIHWVANTPGSIGVLTGGHATLENLDIVGFDNGVRASGSTVNIRGCRIEVNVVGFLLGVRPDGTGWILSRSTISGNSFEANDEAIRIVNLTSSSIQDIGIQGSVNSPSQQSQYGIRIATGSFTSVEIGQAVASGSFAVAAFSTLGGSAGHVTFNNVKASNVLPLPAKAWSIHNPALYSIVNCNYVP